MIHWRLFSATTPSALPMAGRAGSMASMARALSAIIMAIRATNSGKPGPFRAGAAWEVIGARWEAGAGVQARAREIPPSVRPRPRFEKRGRGWQDARL